MGCPELSSEHRDMLIASKKERLVVYRATKIAQGSGTITLTALDTIGK